MESSPDTGTSEAEQEVDSSGDFSEELELFGDLEMDEYEQEASPESSNIDTESNSETVPESTSRTKKDEPDQKQDEEIDITSILDNPEDYWDENKK